jgi:hypothetical protein
VDEIGLGGALGLPLFHVVFEELFEGFLGLAGEDGTRGGEAVAEGVHGGDGLAFRGLGASGFRAVGAGDCGFLFWCHGCH